MSERDFRLLLDVNVLLDNYLPSRPNHEIARRLVECALEHDVQLLYAITGLADFFFIAQATLKREIRAEKGVVTEADAEVSRRLAWSLVDNLSRIATAVGADEADRWVASKERAAHPDLEDNLVVAAARRAQADLLVTDDAQLIKHASVACVSVPTALAHLEALF